MLFKDITILDENYDIKENMYVGVSGQKIDYIGSELPEKDYGEVYPGKGRLLMPAFYNAHAHSTMSLMRGYGENLVLDEWLNNKIFPFEAKLDHNSVYYGTLLAMAESLRFGIAGSQDMYYFIDDMVEAITDSGAKANISRALVNFTGEDFDSMASVQEMKRTVRDLNGCADGRIIMDTSLHGEYTSDEATARALAKFTKENDLILHVHVSETLKEHEECKARHNGMTPVEYLNDCGIFDSRAVAAHCVHCEGDDFDILKEKDVTVSTNPASNMKLASGNANIKKILDKGIKLAIGTDSVASNNSLNFFEEMKLFAMSAKVQAKDPTIVTPKQALRAATRAGALAQGREDCGLLKEGFKADLIVVRTDVPNMHPVHNMLNNLVYSAAGSDVVLTMVDGKVLYENGIYKTIDLEKVIFEAEKATENILKQL